MHIQFLAFSGCPLAEPAKKNLKEALANSGTVFEEIDILDANCPKDLPGWGSPTILINGQDVTGHSKGNNVSCRVYCLLYTSPSPRDGLLSRMPSSA